MRRGSCLCGAVTFQVEGELAPVDACHCVQCRKSNGHFGVGADVPRENLTVQGEENVTWYQSSEKVRRGFCSICGSPMFFDPLDRTRVKWTGVTMATFDDPTGTHIKEHIFVSEKGDYYEIADGLPQYQTIPEHAGGAHDDG